jgi:hypothetical protein
MKASSESGLCAMEISVTPGAETVSDGEVTTQASILSTSKQL